MPNWCKVSVVKALRTLFKGSEGRKAKQIFVHHRGRTNALELLKNVFFTLPIRASIVECLCVSLLPDATQSDAEFCDWSTSQIHSEGNNQYLHAVQKLIIANRARGRG